MASINRLLARLDAAVAAQRRFVAVAAHELRSPLTALTLQAEQLAARIRTGEEKEFMARLQSGLQRMRGLLDQLLTLARAERALSKAHGRELLRLRDPAQRDRGAHAARGGAPDRPRRRRRDGHRCVGSPAKAVDIHAMLRNLLDNAIRYTPVGGRVDSQRPTRGDRVASTSSTTVRASPPTRSSASSIPSTASSAATPKARDWAWPSSG
jgi:two-component system OmpR family sensor kinase